MRRKDRAFTMVELLTVLAIIAMLVGVLIPSLKMVRNISRETAQKAQLATIEMALMAFKSDYGSYPPSSLDIRFGVPNYYCGAQKLAEALVGWDLLGFHPQSDWRADGFDSAGGNTAYDPLNSRLGASLNERRGPYLELATANIFRLGISAAGKRDGLFDLFTISSPLAPDRYVICDVFGTKKINVNPVGAVTKSVNAGTPILYYKANTSSKTIDPAYAPAPNFNQRIYDVRDNDELVKLGVIGDITGTRFHPLGVTVSSEYPVFYGDYTYGPEAQHGIRDPKVTTRLWPYRPDSYILISAGADGLYGTADDIRNF